MGEEEVDHRVGGGVAVHIVVYIVVNLLLIAVWLFSVPSAQLDQIPNYLTHPSQARDAGFWPLYVMVFWGAGLLIHAGIMLVTAPSRWRKQRARAKARRQLQAKVVGTLGDNLLGDAAIAGIRLVDGDKAAKKVDREAARQRSKPSRDKKSDKKSDRRSDRARDQAPSTSARPKRPEPPRRPSHPEHPQRPDHARRAKAAGGDGDASAPTPAGTPPAPAASGRQWVAVLFTDIVDSTTLNHSLGDDEWARLLAQHRSTVRRCVQEHGGVEVGTQGDGFLLRFADPDSAARCAVAIQQHLLDERARAPEDPALLHVRIGMHAGEVVQDDDDIIGKVINLAARVTSAAQPDEILVTEPFADHLSAGHVLVDRGLKSLKGFAQPRHLLAIAWQVVPDEIVLDRQDNQRR